MSNHSAVSEVILVGFPGLAEAFYGLVSTMVFFTYMISLMANSTVICLVTLNANLRQPMYLFIANLAASDLLFDTATLPKLITRYWFGASSIPLRLCYFQIFLVHYLGSMDSFLLMLMAVDRYVAICHPLRYTSIMTNKVVALCCGFCWIVGSYSLNVTVGVLASQIPLCGPNKVNSLYCGYTAFAVLACGDISDTRNVVFLIAMVVLMLPLTVILASYVVIIATILLTRFRSLRKAFYTCVTHLLVISLYFTPRIYIYTVSIIPFVTIKPETSVLLLYLYSFIPHMANPIIYFLRTKEIKQTLRSVLQRNRFRKKDVLCHVTNYP